MKKISVILLVILLVAMSGCSGSGTGSNETEEKKENTGIMIETKDNGTKDFDTTSTIEETEIYNADGITIKVTGLEINPNYGVSGYVRVYLMISNNTDQMYQFYSGTWGML